MTEAIDQYLARTLRGGGNEWPFAAEIEAVWGRIQFHGVAGLLAGQMSSLADWPDDLQHRVKQEAQLQAFWEESHRSVLANLVEGLAQQGVRSLVMKGTALAYSIYDDPSVRRRGDSDLLIRQSQIEVARGQLQARGFIPRTKLHGLFFQETWLHDTGIGFVHAVDLHWQVNDSPAFQRALPVEEFFASARALPRFSPSAAMPGPAHTFLQGAINQASHSARGYYVEGDRVAEAGRLIWACDNHLLSRAFVQTDWEELVQISLARGLAPLCLEALELAQSGFATPMPATVMESLRAAPGNSGLANQLRQTNRYRTFSADLAAIETLRAKWSFIVGHALPVPVHLRKKYPGQAHWPLGILHLRRWAEGAFDWVRRG